MSSAEAEDLLKEGNVCGYCLLEHKDCHNNLFGDYCFEKCKTYTYLYPAAATRETIKAFFIQRYCWALHVHIFLKYEVIANEHRYLFPPPCLEHTMEEAMDRADREHSIVIQGSEYKSVYEYTEAAMSFDGIDSDRT